MRRNYNYNNNGYGREDSQSYMDEYLERITRLQRMPSVATDTPEVVPDAHQTFLVKHDDLHTRTPHVKHQNHATRPEKHKKVHIAEHEKVVETGWDGKREVYEEDKTIDVEADGFIKEQHKNFELSKWDTLKAY